MKEVCLEVKMTFEITRFLKLTDEEYEHLLADGTIPQLEEIKQAMQMGGCEFEVPEFDHRVSVDDGDGTFEQVKDWDD